MTSPGSEQLSQLARDLYRLGPATRRNLGKRFREIGQPVLAEAQRRASWSTRIPAAMRVSSELRDTAVGMRLRVSAAAAPHARSYEGLGGGDTFRHPVFGRSWWVVASTRPFAVPAVRANEGRAAQACADAFTDAARECGFR